MTGGYPGALDLDRLFQLRLVVARFGEMDLARWWNSRGILGRHGAIVLKRGFPSTHCFAGARIVFAVARSRCERLFNPPRCMTLWNLPAEVEEAFEEKWQEWLERSEEWASFFEGLARVREGSLLDLLVRLDLVSGEQCEQVRRLRRSAEGRAVPLPGVHAANDAVITLLAAGFARGEPGRPAIPYARLED